MSLAVNFMGVQAYELSQEEVAQGASKCSTEGEGWLVAYHVMQMIISLQLMFVMLKSYFEGKAHVSARLTKLLRRRSSIAYISE